MIANDLPVFSGASESQSENGNKKVSARTEKFRIPVFGFGRAFDFKNSVITLSNKHKNDGLSVVI